MQIQRLVDLEDYEFDTLLVTYNHKNRLSIELGKVSEIFGSCLLYTSPSPRD